MIHFLNIAPRSKYPDDHFSESSQAGQGTRLLADHLDLEPVPLFGRPRAWISDIIEETWNHVKSTGTNK